MKHIIRITFASLVIALGMLVSCEKDHTLNEQTTTSERSRSMLLGKHRSGDLLFAENKKLRAFLQSQFSSQTQGGSKNIHSSTYGFTIRTDDIQVIESDTYTSYTFIVLRDTYDIYTTENYILTVYDNGSYSQLLATYPLEEIEGTLTYNLDTAHVEHIVDPHLLYAKTTEPCTGTMQEIIEWDSSVGDCINFPCRRPTGDGTHGPGENCNAQGDDRAYQVCSGAWVVTGCTQIGGATGGSGPFGSPSGGGNDEPNNPDPDEEGEVPIVPVIPAWQQIANCMNSHAYGSLNGSSQAPLSNDETSWLQSTNRNVTSPMLTYLITTYNCSSLSANFNDLAIDELIDGAEIEYEEKIINKLTGKSKCVYNKIKSQNMVRRLLNKFQEQQSPARLKLEMADLTEAYGETLQPDENDLIRILINNDDTVYGADYQPNVMLAQTLFHEIIHAEFFREIIIAIGAGNYHDATAQEIIDALQTSDYPTLYEHYRKYKDWSHTFMANYFRESIAEVTQEYVTGIPVAQGQQPQAIYMILAWRGLRTPLVPAWNTLTTSQKMAINDTIDAYVTSNANQTCTE